MPFPNSTLIKNIYSLQKFRYKKINPVSIVSGTESRLGTKFYKNFMNEILEIQILLMLRKFMWINSNWPKLHRPLPGWAGRFPSQTVFHWKVWAKEGPRRFSTSKNFKVFSKLWAAVLPVILQLFWLHRYPVWFVPGCSLISCYSQKGPLSSIVSHTRELVKNADSQATAQTTCFRICLFKKILPEISMCIWKTLIYSFSLYIYMQNNRNTYTCWDIIDI